MQTTKVYVANEDTMELQLMTQPLVDVTTGDLYLAVDQLETLLTDIKSNQTNGSQFVKVKNVSGNTINPATEETLSEQSIKKYADPNNTTDTPLGAGGVFTGTWSDTTNYVQAIVILVTDQSAAAGGLKFDYSRDGVTVDHSHTFSPTSNYPNGHHYPCTLDVKYFRVVYTNGATPQGNFKLITTLLKNQAEEGHVHPINYAIDNDHPAPIFRCVNVGETTAGGGGFVNVKVTPSGALTADVTQATSPWVVTGNVTPSDTKANPSTSVSVDALLSAWDPVGGNWTRLFAGVTNADAQAVSTANRSLQTRSVLYGFNGTTFDRLRSDTTNGLDVDVTRLPTSYLASVAAGTVTGSLGINKFGNAPMGIQVTATDIWDRADSTPTQQIWLAPTAARIHAIVSSDANDDGNPVGTGARTIRIWGLQTWASAESSEDITMNGVGSVNTANSYVIIHRMKVLTMGSAGPNVGTITATAATDGTITAVIRPGNGQTEMAIYGVPSTKTAYMYRWGCAINKSSAAVTDVDFRLLVNENPDAQTTGFLRKDDISLESNGTSQFDRHYAIPYKIAGPAIIKVQAIGSAADIDGDSGFDLEVK